MKRSSFLPETVRPMRRKNSCSCFTVKSASCVPGPIGFTFSEAFLLGFRSHRPLKLPFLPDDGSGRSWCPFSLFSSFEGFVFLPLALRDVFSSYSSSSPSSLSISYSYSDSKSLRSRERELLFTTALGKAVMTWPVLDSLLCWWQQLSNKI